MLITQIFVFGGEYWITPCKVYSDTYAAVCTEGELTSNAAP